jgi:hypothetical protein
MTPPVLRGPLTRRLSQPKKNATSVKLGAPAPRVGPGTGSDSFTTVTLSTERKPQGSPGHVCTWNVPPFVESTMKEDSPALSNTLTKPSFCIKTVEDPLGNL